MSINLWSDFCAIASQSADGYILEMHRIPFSKRVKGRFQRSRQFGNKYAKRMSSRPVVFLQHGLLCSSSDWVLNPTDRGLAYMLADRGYDVWMGNARGNTYSNKHIFLKETDEAFWKFTYVKRKIWILMTHDLHVRATCDIFHVINPIPGLPSPLFLNYSAPSINHRAF